MKSLSFSISIHHTLDYQAYAAEHPEELARAIAKGIPATIRGMMWQHM